MFLYIIYSVLGCVIMCKLIAILTKGHFQTNVCLQGKTALVTGGNSGMGYEISVFLASRGCRVIIADVMNSTKTVESIISQTKNPNVIYTHLDLASFTSVRKCAAILLFNEPRLDIVINNAGCGGFKEKTEDDIYKVLQVNFLGHFLLTHLLSPLLKTTKNARVVFVSSLLAFTNNLAIDKDINCGVKWQLPVLSEVLDYGNAKVCILAAAMIFAKEFKKHDIVVASCHPGLVKTPIFRKSFHNYGNKQSLFTFLVSLCVYFGVAVFGKTPKEGIQSTLYCALSENIQSGDFIIDCHKFFQPLVIYNPKFCQYIWSESIRLANIQNDEMLTC